MTAPIPAQSLVERIRDTAIALLPPGNAFAKSIVGDLAKVLESISVEPARALEQADRLLANYDPATAVELLPEWENAVGIALTQERTLGGWKSFSATTKGQHFQAPHQFQDGKFRFGFVPSVASSGITPGGYMLAHAPTLAIFFLAPSDNGNPNVARFYFRDQTGLVLVNAYLTFTAGQLITFEVDAPNGKVTITTPSAGAVTYTASGAMNVPSGEWIVGLRETIPVWVLQGEFAFLEAYEEPSPEPVVGELAATVSERQAAVVTKLRGRTSHAKSVFEDAALALGFGSPGWMQVGYWTNPATTAPMVVGSRFVAPPQFLDGLWSVTYLADRDHTAVTQQGYLLAHVDSRAAMIVYPSSGTTYVSFLGPNGQIQLALPVAFNAGDTLTFVVNAGAGTLRIDKNGVESTQTYSSASGLRFPPGEYRVADREFVLGTQTADNFALQGAVTSVQYYDRTGIRWAQLQPALAGRARAGEAITNDTWANVVVAYVPAVGVSDNAKASLRSAWNYLTRSHGYVHIIYTGASGSTFVPRGMVAIGTSSARMSLVASTAGGTFAPFGMRANGVSTATMTLNATYPAGLAEPPAGYAYVVDGAGNYMVDTAGNYMIAPTGEAPTGTARPSTSLGVGFYVVGKKLYDANGTEFRMRGTNKTHQDNWSQGLGNAGSNATRWVLYYNEEPNRCINDMTSENIGGSTRRGDAVAIGGYWDGTCNDSSTTFNTMVARWVRDAVIYQTTVVDGYPFERYFILNIANEWGGDGLAWRNAYVTAIPQIRAAGFHGCIMVDAPGCGQNPQPVIQYGADILNADPEKNVMFSLHVYGNFYDTGSGIGQSWSEQNDLAPSLAALAATGLCVIVGEFGPGRNIGPSPTMITPQRIIGLCETLGLGWLSWSWDDNNLGSGMSDDNSFSHSYSGNYNSSADLTIFGKVIVEDPVYGWLALANKASIF